MLFVWALWGALLGAFKFSLMYTYQGLFVRPRPTWSASSIHSYYEYVTDIGPKTLINQELNINSNASSTPVPALEPRLELFNMSVD